MPTLLDALFRGTDDSESKVRASLGDLRHLEPGAIRTHRRGALPPLRRASSVWLRAVDNRLLWVVLGRRTRYSRLCESALGACSSR